MNIEEMIADAKAEEEVKAAQEKSENNDFREALKERLKATFTNRESATVTVSLVEYTTLTSRSLDLDRILNALIRGLRLGYSGDSLRLDGDLVLNTFMALYPDIYEGLLEKHKADAKGDE